MSGTVHHFRSSGLDIRSEFELPGMPVAPAQPQPDVRIIRAALAPPASAAEPTLGAFHVVDGGLLLSVPGIARFLVRDGNEILVDIEPGARDGDAAIYLVGSAFGALLHQRGLTVLHASAVDVGGAAVAFCGAAGAGKSTLAAALGQRGFPLLVDDVCAVARDAAGHPLVRPDGRQLKLWSDAVGSLALGARAHTRVRSLLDKFYVLPRIAGGTDAMALRALYVLWPGEGIDAPRLEPLDPIDALAAIRANAYPPGLMEAVGPGPSYFADCVAIAKSVKIFKLSRPWGYDRLGTIVDHLVDHWRRAGLSAGAGGDP
jgi:hypothetical protein